MYSVKEAPMSEFGQIVCECDTDTPCCVALDAEPIDEQRSTDLAAGFKALGDPHRIAIVQPGSDTWPPCRRH
jgi:hypothetical protein